MREVMRAAVGSLVLVFGLQFSTSVATRSQTETLFAPSHEPTSHRRIPEDVRSGASPFVRTELFFGTARAGVSVTEEQFRNFVDAEVRPRFPDGLTLLEARGQFKRGDMTIDEQSFVLILLYPFKASGSCSRKIQRIRDLYKQQFQQDSVLRVDSPDIVWVSF